MTPDISPTGLMILAIVDGVGLLIMLWSVICYALAQWNIFVRGLFFLVKVDNRYDAERAAFMQGVIGFGILVVGSIGGMR